MKNIQNIFIICIAIFFFVACNKESIDQNSSAKQNEKKEALTESKNSQTDKNTSASELQLYKINKVEKQSGKKTAPNFFWSEGGKDMSLNELKGNVVLVNLWATWCGPCIKEMPDLSKISEEMNGKNFRMLGMNVFQQDGSRKVEDFLKTNPVSYTVLDGNQEIVDAFGEATGTVIEAIPTTFIIDKDGKIAETIVGGRDKESFLRLINKYVN